MPIVTAQRVVAGSIFLVTGYSAYSLYKTRRSPPTMITHTFQTLFAVPLSCDGCVKSVSDELYKLPGVTKVEGNIADQLITVSGSTAPSVIVGAIQDTGRDAILRGSGTSNSAAVSILETFTNLLQPTDIMDRNVRGLARMVQVSDGHTLIDVTVRGVSPGTYRATIREYGSLEKGAVSTGSVWTGASSGGEARADRGFVGAVEVGADGRGAAFVDCEWNVWEVIGHAMVLTRHREGEIVNDDDTVVGVVARSAGVWDNDKTVCSCTGKTLWEERKDEVKKGML